MYIQLSDKTQKLKNKCEKKDTARDEMDTVKMKSNQIRNLC